MIFKPEIAAKFKDCGIYMLDSHEDIISVALNYLGLDPNAAASADEFSGRAGRSSKVMKKQRPRSRVGQEN